MAEETKQNNDAASDEAAEAPARRRVKRASKEAEAEAPKAKAKATKEAAEEGEAPAKRTRRTKKADDADASQASAEKKEAAAEKPADGASEGAAEGDSSQSAVGGLFSGVKSTISNATEQVKTVLNNFIDALAVMIVTSCLIPLLVMLFFIWLVKILLGSDRGWMRMPPRRPGMCREEETE